jgi:hypothetical protein
VNERGAPPADIMQEVSRLRALVGPLKAAVAAEQRERQRAESETRNAIVRADRAEHSERQVSADRDRWKRLALGYEAQLRSLAPRLERV